MTKRNDPIVKANSAAQVLQNPEFVEAFNSIRENLLNEMERLTLDGTNDKHAVMLVQKLQSARDFKAQLIRIVKSGERAIQREERDDKTIDISSPTQRNKQL